MTVSPAKDLLFVMSFGPRTAETSDLSPWGTQWEAPSLDADPERGCFCGRGPNLVHPGVRRCQCWLPCDISSILCGSLSRQSEQLTYHMPGATPNPACLPILSNLPVKTLEAKCCHLHLQREKLSHRLVRDSAGRWQSMGPWDSSRPYLPLCPAARPVCIRDPCVLGPQRGKGLSPPPPHSGLPGGHSTTKGPQGETKRPSHTLP